jgi:hypothetical protein
MKPVGNVYSRCYPNNIDCCQKIACILLVVPDLTPLIEKIMLSCCVAVISVYRGKLHLNSIGFNGIAQIIEVRLNMSRNFLEERCWTCNETHFFVRSKGRR